MGAVGAIIGAVITSVLAFVASYLNRKAERHREVKPSWVVYE